LTSRLPHSSELSSNSSRTGGSSDSSSRMDRRPRLRLRVRVRSLQRLLRLSVERRHELRPSFRPERVERPKRRPRELLHVRTRVSQRLLENDLQRVESSRRRLDDVPRLGSVGIEERLEMSSSVLPSSRCLLH